MDFGNFDPNDMTPDKIQEVFRDAEENMRATLAILKISALMVSNDENMTNDEKFAAAVKVVREYGDQRVMESMLNK